MAAQWTLERILHPLPLNKFLADCWTVQPLHIARNCAEFYSGLISLAEIERYLAMEELLKQQSITTPKEGYGIPDAPPNTLSEVYNQVLLRNSLRIRHLERIMDPSSLALALLRSMERTLQHPKDSLSCYITPAGAVGLGPHHDETEIFTLQITGTKHWCIYHRADTGVREVHPRETLSRPQYDLTLHPGDLLYLPRGYVHDVTSHEPSFSLTIVFDPVKWSAVLEVLMASLSSTPAFMMAMPAGTLLATTPPETLVNELRVRIEMIRNALDQLTTDVLLNHIAPRLLSRMMVPPRKHLQNILAVDGISLDTLLQRPPESDWHLHERKTGGITLTLKGGATVSASEIAESVLRDVLIRADSFRVSEMHAMLSEDTKLALARQLVTCGLLSIIEEHE